METSFAYATTRVLVSGVDLEVFTQIANGNHIGWMMKLT
jgi:hypothetical protein